MEADFSPRAASAPHCEAALWTNLQPLPGRAARYSFTPEAHSADAPLLLRRTAPMLLCSPPSWLLGFLASRLLGFSASRLLGFLASRLLGFSASSLFGFSLL